MNLVGGGGCEDTIHNSTYHKKFDGWTKKRMQSMILCWYKMCALKLLFVLVITFLYSTSFTHVGKMVKLSTEVMVTHVQHDNNILTIFPFWNWHNTGPGDLGDYMHRWWLILPPVPVLTSSLSARVAREKGHCFIREMLAGKGIRHRGMSFHSAFHSCPSQWANKHPLLPRHSFSTSISSSLSGSYRETYMKSLRHIGTCSYDYFSIVFIFRTEEKWSPK